MLPDVPATHEPMFPIFVILKESCSYITYLWHCAIDTANNIIKIYTNFIEMWVIQYVVRTRSYFHKYFTF